VIHQVVDLFAEYIISTAGYGRTHTIQYKE